VKKTWEGINEMLYRRKRNFKNITKLKDKGKIVKEASQILPWVPEDIFSYRY